jgi:hypothetical protein
LRKYSFILFLFTFFIASSCKDSFHFIEKNNEDLLAEVNGHKLYKSDLASVLSSEESDEDSIRILKGMINNWVKDQLMILEAEKNMPKDMNLDKMIQDYRSSLLLYNYETKLAIELLDTLVTKDQKQSYYNNHKEEFILSEAVGKFVLAKVPSKAKGIDNFSEQWKKGNQVEIESFCKQHAEYTDLDGNKWKSINELMSFLPKNLISKSSLEEDKVYRKKDGDYEYFIKIIKYAEEESNPPFEYIESKIEKVLMNDRKRNLLRQKKQQLFDKEANGSQVKIYVK